MSILLKALRSLLRRRSFTAVSVATLGLAIGLSTAAFSVLNGVLLQPLPYPRSDRLVVVHAVSEKAKESPAERIRQDWNRLPLDYGDYLDIKSLQGVFQAVGLYADAEGLLEGSSGALQVSGARVNDGLLRALAVRPRIGRWIQAEDVAKQRKVILLSHGYWRRQFGGAAQIIGKPIIFEGARHEVIGVMPRGFRVDLHKEHEFYLPLRLDPRSRDYAAYDCIARLAPGVQKSHALASLGSIGEENKHRQRQAGFRLLFLLEDAVEDSRRFILLFNAVSILAVLAACGNVSSLVMSSNIRRQHEFAVKASLGATSRQLLKELLLEGLATGVIAAAAGLGLAQLGISVLLAYLPAEMPRAGEVGIDVWSLGFAILLGAAAPLVFGLVPALRSVRLDDLANCLKRSKVVRTRGFGTGWRRSLVAGQIAAAVVLLVLCALLTASFWRLASVDMGFQAQGVVIQKIAFEKPDGDAKALFDFYRQALSRVSQLPGVDKVGASSRKPFAGGEFSLDVELPDQGRTGHAALEIITGEFLAALQIPLIQGNRFPPGNLRRHRPIALVNEAAARSFWPDGRVLGQTLSLSRIGEKSERTVVGVVGDVRYRKPSASASPRVYVPLSQMPFGGMRVVVRSSGRDVDSVAADVQSLAREMAENAAAVPPPQRLDALIDESVDNPRSRMVLFSSAAGFVVLLCLVGVFGLVSSSVGQLTREIGIRKALGATRSDIYGLVGGQLLATLGVGLGLGLAAALAASETISGFLFGLRHDAAGIYAVVALCLTLLVLLAALWPATRAARIEPFRVINDI